jgi:hypothetical protein
MNPQAQRAHAGNSMKKSSGAIGVHAHEPCAERIGEAAGGVAMVEATIILPGIKQPQGLPDSGSIMYSSRKGIGAGESPRSEKH